MRSAEALRDVGVRWDGMYGYVGCRTKPGRRIGLVQCLVAPIPPALDGAPSERSTRGWAQFHQWECRY